MEGFGKRKQYDYLLVGAGLFNAVFAYEASKRGKRCLVIDKRTHLGGNVYCENIEGICVHKYGPHIFHTNNKQVWDYVNALVPFNDYMLRTIANFEGRLYSLPFNMHTFYQMWGTVTPAEALVKIEAQRREASGMVQGQPHNLEEQALTSLGRDIYETLVKGYTEKQWGRSCRDLPPFIIKRLPLRFTYDNNYFDDRFQGIPQGGYNKLIKELLRDVECKTTYNYFENKNLFDRIAQKTVYTGAIDEYFGYCLGRLEYRSLRFEHEMKPCANWQGNPIINYTSLSQPFTRIVEHKHFEPNNMVIMNKPLTVVTKEIPQMGHNNQPYYPINDERNHRLYRKYQELAKQETKVIFGGRLAEYKYYDMDDIVVHALNCVKMELGMLPTR